jgi:hypothetical protein
MDKLSRFSMLLFSDFLRPNKPIKKAFLALKWKYNEHKTMER